MKDDAWDSYVAKGMSVMGSLGNRFTLMPPAPSPSTAGSQCIGRGVRRLAAARWHSRSGQVAAGQSAVAFVRDFVGSGKPVAAICHSPWTLVEAGVVC